MISCANAEEVAPDEVENECEEQAPDHKSFLSLIGIANSIDTCINGIILVAPLEVNEIPDSKEGERNDSKHACNPESSSASLLIFCEESDEEYTSDNKWNETKNSNWYVPPDDELIQKCPENFTEQRKSNEESKDSDNN